MCIQVFLDGLFPSSFLVFCRYSITEPSTCEVRVSPLGCPAAHASLCGKSDGGSLLMQRALHLSAGTHFALGLMICKPGGVSYV